MNKLFIHIPAFVQTDTYPVYEFETQEELLAMECLEYYITGRSDHFEMADDMLMAVSKDKSYWWVVGRIQKPSEMKLPKWSCPE